MEDNQNNKIPEIKKYLKKFSKKKYLPKGSSIFFLEPIQNLLDIIF